MAYEHGITMLENDTSITPPVATSSAVQVVVGTAPIHLSEDPWAAVNKPILANTLDEATKKLGYSDNFEKYTLCESVYASFQLFQVAPLVLINVLDPDLHKKSVTAHPLTMAKGQVVINEEGVLLKSIILKDTAGTKTYIQGNDYTVSFNKEGKPVISRSFSSQIPESSSLKVDFDQIDPSLVTKEDIIGGYDVATAKYTGAELIRQVFPMFNLVPGLLLAPGWSHIPEVGLVLDAKTSKINGNFNCLAVLDADSSTIKSYEEVGPWKMSNGYSGSRSVVCWPKAQVGTKILSYSAIVAARTAATDAENEDVPSVSPSNKTIPITGTVLSDGTEIFLDQVQANHLNSVGVVTALNWNGWRTWGNNTAVYPSSTDPKDRFISIRRLFDWWGNTFISSYFSSVDDPTNFRLIEQVVDSENLRANGYEARGQIAGASIEFRQDMNPTTDILNGKITFIQKIGAFPPAEHIVNILEFDPTILEGALYGGGQ